MNEDNQKIWKEDELLKLNEFVLSKKKDIVYLFYKNIFNASNLVRRKNKFFNLMSIATGKEIKQCKSKFQKLEKYLYKDVLKLPENHIHCFFILKSQRKFFYENGIKIKPTKIINLTKFKEWIEGEKFKEILEIRNKIIQEFRDQKFEACIAKEEIGNFF